MRIAFLNLCHTDAPLVARASSKLTRCEDFDVYVHVDRKSDIGHFTAALSAIPRVYFADERVEVYWGGFNAIKATVALLRQAMESGRRYDYFAILQNHDYPIRSNDDIIRFFDAHSGKEFIRGCPIARTKDWHYARKYKIYNQRDNVFYLKKHAKPRMYARYAHMLLRSCGTLFSRGVINEAGQNYDIYYGAAQWAVTRALAGHFLDFYDSHPKYNRVMAHIQFPDEEYFHTITHNSPFKYSCVKYDEPIRRWLVNWRNLHYFEYPGSISVLTDADYDKIITEDALFIRKVRSGISDRLLDRIDLSTNT